MLKVKPGKLLYASGLGMQTLMSLKLQVLRTTPLVNGVTKRDFAVAQGKLSANNFLDLTQPKSQNLSLQVVPPK
jgi:hypothetical protein